LVHAAALVNPGQERAVAVPTTQGLSHPHTPFANVQWPVWRKFGFGAMLADGLAIELGTFGAGGLFGVVVVVVGGTVVVTAGTVDVVTGIVVVDDCCAVDRVGTVVVTEVDDGLVRDEPVRDVRATCATMTGLRGVVTTVWWRVEACVLGLSCEWMWAIVVVVVPAVAIVVTGDVVLAITGSAVVLNATPTMRNPSEPTTTKRRGAR
jgi:hypothetical protein